MATIARYRSRNSLVRLTRIGMVLGVVGVSLLALAARAGNIFDDGWNTPPAHKSLTTAPANAATQPATPTAAATAQVAQSPHSEPMKPPPATVIPVAHRPIPAAEDQANSRKLMTTLFARELADRSAAGRAALSGKLLDAATTTSAESPSDQFVLLLGAIGAAEDSANVKLCLRAIDALATLFEVDGQQMKVDALLNMPLKTETPAGTAENLAAALPVVDELVASEQYRAAAGICAALRPGVATDPALLAQIRSRQTALESLLQASDMLARQLEKLKVSPDDPAANLAAGRQLCFNMDHWERGLPMLAKGTDPALAALAKRDLARPGAALARKEVGDGWWNLASAQPSAAGERCKARAAQWYRSAEPELTGLAKSFVQSRLATLPASIAGAGGARGGRVLHLLPLVDDAGLSKAHWTRDGSAIVTNIRDQHSTMTLCYAAPAEYDLLARFVRVDGNDDMLMGFPVGDSTCNFSVGTTSHWSWIGAIDGHWNVTDNPSRVQAPLVTGQRYEVLVKVRRNGVEAYLDGKLLCQYETDGSDVLANDWFAAHSPRMILLGSWKSEFHFEAVDVVEITGTGALGVREPDGSPICPLPQAADAQGAFNLRAFDAMIHGDRMHYEPPPRKLGAWNQAKTYASWIVDVKQRGSYAVQLTYSANADSGDVAVCMEGGQTLPFHVANTGDWQTSRTEPLGNLLLPAGRATLNVKCVEKPRSGPFMNLWNITLTPVGNR